MTHRDSASTCLIKAAADSGTGLPRAQQQLATDVYPCNAGSTFLREDLVDEVIDILITRSDPHPEMAGQGRGAGRFLRR